MTGRTLLNRGEGVPLVVDHDEDRVIGRVVEFYSADDAGGGRWIWARAIERARARMLRSRLEAAFAEAGKVVAARADG
jgi:hypothetical protein